MFKLITAALGAGFSAATGGAGSVIVAVLQFLLGTKTGRIILLCLIGLAAFGAWTWHVEDKAAAEQKAKDLSAELQVTQAESDRRNASLADSHRYGAAIAARNAKTERDYADAVAKLRRAEAANRRHRCLDDRSIDRLRGLDGAEDRPAPGG